MRKFIGRILEWFLCYRHKVVYDGPGFSPHHKYDGDAGYDLYVNKDVIVKSKQVAEVSTGVFIDPRANIWFEIKGRSSTFNRRGLQVVEAVIDRDFRGEMFAIVYNPGSKDVVIASGERLVQLIPHRVISCDFVRGTLSNSRRGINGFGSSGA